MLYPAHTSRIVTTDVDDPHSASANGNHQFPTVDVLGVHFQCLTSHDLVGYLVEQGKQDSPTTVGYVNALAVNLACDFPWFRRYLAQCDLVSCDGFGVLMAAQWKGYAMAKEFRTTCPDYFESLMRTLERGGLSLYLLGSQVETVELALSRIRQIATNLRVGGHHGYFDLSGSENDKVIERINSFQPDVLLVGLGMPLQEQWIMNNRQRLDANVVMSVGGCLEYFTQRIQRGPAWMTDNGLEWLSRLMSEPRRLWRRYLIGNLMFCCRVIADDFFSSVDRVPRTNGIVNDSSDCR